MARTRPTPEPRDPDFERHPARAAPPGADLLPYYQRLVVNPFLGAAIALGSGGLAIVLLATPMPGLALAAVAAGTALGYLAVQFHCLDCGATGAFSRRDRHACGRVLDRWNRPGALPFGGFPDARAQGRFWLFALAVAAFLRLVVGSHR